MLTWALVYHLKDRDEDTSGLLFLIAMFFDLLIVEAIARGLS